MNKRIVVLHGYTATPQHHWFPWLSEELELAGYAVTVPQLPNPEKPNVDVWAAEAQLAFGEIDESLTIVAHSLGCIGALHALDRSPGDWTLGRLILVSGFAEPLANLPELDGFTDQLPDLDRIAAQTAHRHVIVSDFDSVVATEATERLATRLDATLDEVLGGGHFCASEGHTTLPRALQLALRDTP